MTEIWVSIISALATIIGVIITTIVGGRRQTEKVIAGQDLKQGIMETKLDDLTREVREHNNFAKRMPVIENEVANLSRRVDNLERKE